MAAALLRHYGTESAPALNVSYYSDRAIGEEVLAIRLVVAVTDYDWFTQLRRMIDLTEVNFWSPSEQPFRALTSGEQFLFKLHSPRNYIVGGGIFSHATILPCSLAWEAFGPANGASSLQQMRQRIGKYRRVVPDAREDFSIGCRILTQPVFLNEADWIPVPESWSKNIVSFKRYSSDEADGKFLWETFAERFERPTISEGFAEGPPARYGEPALIRPRLGQGAFRILVTDSYRRRCAVTGEKTLPALDAAHIKPFSDHGSHEVRNGLLLRRDIHSLFDSGYVTVTPSYHFEVSRRIKDEFENGRDYYALHGKSVALPEQPQQAPDPTSLNWHNETIYKG